jgi:beta-galactosidase/beta-glucuronidase
VSTGADTFQTRFGMREFRFEPRQGDRPGRAYLNGKPYFLRGSNVTLYRFLEDPDRGVLPWTEDWVRLLHRRFRDMNWNSLRYCIGFPPEFWYRIADEGGVLIQDEFPLWYFWPPKPGDFDSDELAQEYTEWMHERWNHPCVVIWDACNETAVPTREAVKKVRGLDFSNRPWDNGWCHPRHRVIRLNPIPTIS